MKAVLVQIFNKLNQKIELENKQRKTAGTVLIARSRIEILGQTSLLAQPEMTYNLNLVQTGDLDALIRADYFVKKQLKDILPEYGFIYDEDSPFIFIPSDSKYSNFLDLSFVEVVVIDPESALVSKAVKSPEKNIQLIRQAIALNLYPNLIQRIIKEGGDLKKFI